MFKLWISFAVLVTAIHFGIAGWRSLTGREKLDLTKSVFYSIVVSLLAIAGMSLIVILF